jgi:hypothetical protein
MHHIGDPAHRMQMLHEFHRVTRDTVILSLWVDGNYKAWRRQKLEAKRAKRAVRNPVTRTVLYYQRRKWKSEFAQAGFL